MDCHIPSVHASIALIFQNFSCHGGYDAVLNETCKYLSLSGLHMSHDSAARRDVLHPIDMSQFFKSINPLQTGPIIGGKKKFEFWFVNIWPLVQSYFPPPFSIYSIWVIFWLNELDPSFTLVEYDILMMQFCAFTTLVYSHPKNFSLLILV